MELIQNNNNLTKYTEASLKEFFRLVFPCVLILFSGALMTICDRMLLYRYSCYIANACNLSGYLCTLFLAPLTIFSQGAQVYVARYYGEDRKKEIGPVIWQTIWFLFLLYPLIIFSGYVVEYFFIQGTETKLFASAYFRILIFGIPLFGLNAAFSAFFIGRGKTKVVLIITTVALIINFVLDWLLIFGWKTIIPELGIEGAAYATIIAQFFSFAVLFMIFLYKKNSTLYGTRNFHFNIEILFKVLKVGLPRSLMMLSFYMIGVFSTDIMTKKGGLYLDLVSLMIFFTYIISILRAGLVQTVITIVSYLIGKGKSSLIPKVIANATIYTFMMCALFSIPLVFQVELVFYYMFPAGLSSDQLLLLKSACIFICLSTLILNFSNMLTGVLTAAKDTFFHFTISQLLWITSYLPLFIAIRIFSLPPYVYFMIYTVAFVIELFIVVWRVRTKVWKKLVLPSREISNEY